MGSNLGRRRGHIVQETRELRGIDAVAACEEKRLLAFAPRPVWRGEGVVVRGEVVIDIKTGRGHLGWARRHLAPCAERLPEAARGGAAAGRATRGEGAAEVD